MNQNLLETKEKIKEIIQLNKFSFSNEIKNKFPTIFSIISILPGKSISEKIFRYLNTDIDGKCVVCGNECRFINFTKGYSKTCSSHCSGIYKKKTITKTCEVCGKTFSTTPKINRITCSDECLIKMRQSNDFKRKMVTSVKDTCIKKYGKTSWLLTEQGKLSVQDGIKKSWKNSETKKERIKKTNSTKIKRYGTANNYEKILKTKLEKYGDSKYSNRNKWKDTMLSKYGRLQAPTSQKALQTATRTNYSGFGSEKHKNSMVRKYGVTNAMKSPTIVNKIKYAVRKESLKSIYKRCHINNCTPIFDEENFTKQKQLRGEFIYYKIKCNTCNTIFDASFANGGITKCPTCLPCTVGKSATETELFNFIASILPKSNIERNKRNIISPFELDIFIPEKNIAIEFDGILWHSDSFAGKNSKYHLNKTLMCNSIGIKLIHIFESEWILNKEIVKSRIKSILGIQSLKIFARKCEVKEISSNECKNFLEINHLQGNIPASIKLGLFNNNELISVMTFGKLRVATGGASDDGHYELYRFASKINMNIVGGASKLLSFFIKTRSPKRIITYANIRYSGFSPFYEVIGFKKSETTPPSYWVFNKNTPLKLWHRFSFRKSVLKDKLPNFDPTLTEWENLKNNNFDRIWDCGNIKYELTP